MNKFVAIIVLMCGVVAAGYHAMVAELCLRDAKAHPGGSDDRRIELAGVLWSTVLGIFTASVSIYGASEMWNG